jgi:hypothetical protein
MSPPDAENPVSRSIENLLDLLNASELGQDRKESMLEALRHMYRESTERQPANAESPSSQQSAARPTANDLDGTDNGFAAHIVKGMAKLRIANGE